MFSNRSALYLLGNNVQKLNLRSVQTTSILNAAPMKKKKTDAALVQLRIERKKRKFERAVKQLEAQEKIKIPLAEYTVDKEILKNLNEWKRKNAEKLNEIKDEFEQLNTIWLMYKGIENKLDYRCTQRVLKTKLNTLKQLRILSPKLYENSLQLDETLFPFKDEQMVKDTISNEDYKPNDGQVVDVTKVWKIEI